METQFGLYWGSFVLSAMPWLVGFYAQKISNARRLDAYRFKSRRSWIWLLGLKPGRDDVYIGPATFQVWAIIALASGFVAIYFWGNYGFRLVLYTVYIGGLLLMALIGWIIRLTTTK